MNIEVMVVGALGKMGREIVNAIKAADGVDLAGAVDVKSRGQIISELTGDPGDMDAIWEDLGDAIDEVKPEVIVDFTNPQAVFNNARLALRKGVNCVVGTTGLDERELAELDQIARSSNKAILVIPNFAIGAVLMMRFACEAARYFPNVEIIELHHDAKLDAPSGTAIKTAEMIGTGRHEVPISQSGQFEKYPGARGGKVENISIHSVRLPGYVAHQEVLFGGKGQALTIRHDAFNRECFMPGVILSVKKTRETVGLVYGLENLI